MTQSTKPCFGPFYAEPLQASVNHAERFTRALRHLESEVLGSRWSDPRDPTDAELWLLGRADEVEAFVVDLTREVIAGYLSCTRSAITLDGYLAMVHEGFASHFGSARADCCGPAISTRDTAAIGTREAPLGAAAMAQALASIFTPTPAA